MEPYNLSETLKHTSQDDLLTLISNHIDTFYELAEIGDIKTDGLLDKYKQTDDWLQLEYKYQSLICAFDISLKEHSYFIIGYGKLSNHFNVFEILTEMTIYMTFKDKFILFTHDNKRDALVSYNEIIYVASTEDDDILEISKHFAEQYHVTIDIVNLSTDTLTEDVEKLLIYYFILEDYYEIKKK